MPHRAGRCIARLVRPTQACVVAAACLVSGLLTPHLSGASELRRDAVVQAIQRIQPAVVNIHGEKSVRQDDRNIGVGDSQRRVNGMGTGVLIDERGYILTNYHVVEGVQKIQVSLPDARQFVARLVAHDAQTDLAVIKIESTKDLPVITIGTSEDLMLGEPVIAVGNAYGYENTVTRGIVSALHRTVQVTDAQTYEDLIQTDASINPGNSGGPLINIDGEMVGLNVAVRAGAAGIGFAIPVDKAMRVAASLLSSRVIDRTWHGIVAEQVNVDGERTVVVKSVEDDSPAVDTGLQAGDVLLSIDGQPIQRTLDLERLLVGRKAGEDVALAIERDGDNLDLNLVLTDLPKSAILDTDDPTWDVLGVRLEPIPSKQFAAFRSRYRGGLEVSEVRKGGPAAKQGIRRGDVLVGMHVWETVSLENVTYILNRSDFETLAPLKFYILRGNDTLYGHINVSMRDTTR
jgi:serine protease Do